MQLLLDAGIDVDHDEHTTSGESERSGLAYHRRPRPRTIPDWVVQQADEVVMTDVTPRSCCIVSGAVLCMDARRPIVRWRISSRSRH